MTSTHTRTHKHVQTYTHTIHACMHAWGHKHMRAHMHTHTYTTLWIGLKPFHPNLIRNVIYIDSNWLPILNSSSTRTYTFKVPNTLSANVIGIVWVYLFVNRVSEVMGTSACQVNTSTSQKTSTSDHPLASFSCLQLEYSHNAHACFSVYLCSCILVWCMMSSR